MKGYKNVKVLFYEQVAFAEFALFFYDKYGGSYIAVLWKPQAFLATRFQGWHIRICNSVGYVVLYCLGGQGPVQGSCEH